MAIEVTLKLFAHLADLLPPERRNNRVTLTVPEGETVAALLARYRVPEEQAHLVLVNGVYIDPAARASHVLQGGDEVAVWPKVAGG